MHNFSLLMHDLNLLFNGFGAGCMFTLATKETNDSKQNCLYIASFLMLVNFMLALK